MKIKILSLIFASLLIITPGICDDLPPPYCYIRPLPFDPQSMFSDECAYHLEKLIKEYDVKTVIEVGSWVGASTRAIAKFLPEEGKVYAVDHWRGSAEHAKRHKEKLPKLYHQFLSNVIHEKLTHKIVPIRMSSQEAAKALNVVPDLIYIDASHDEESVYKDLVAWWPFVKGHGIMCGDDWKRHGDPVEKAVKRFAKENNLSAQGHRWFWLLSEN